MADIFSNAYLTIAASAAKSGQEGLLNRTKNPQFSILHTAEVYTVFTHRFINHELRMMYDDKDWNHDYRCSDETTFPKLTELTLRERAWCLQEEILSTRVIHFTQDEMVFICREGTICERQSDWVSRFALPPFIGVGDKSPLSVWMKIIMHYSGRDISFLKDKLPALSGLRSDFEQNAGRYLGGFWEFHMPECLLWQSFNGCRPRQSSSEEFDPTSWSWASMDGQIYWSDIAPYMYTIVAELLGAEMYSSSWLGRASSCGRRYRGTLGVRMGRRWVRYGCTPSPGGR